MPESSKQLNDLNKVFIPCRTVLEMEALTSLYLSTKNYDSIKENPESHPSSQYLIQMYGILGNEPLMSIIDYFINCAVPKIKPVVMYERDHHDRIRMGNIEAYTKTRVCLYLALHRLKLKFLILKKFLNKFKENEYDLDFYPLQESIPNQTLMFSLYKFYYDKNVMNLKLMLPKKKVSTRVSNLIDTQKSITSEKIINLSANRLFSDEKNQIKFIMREIKASLYVCKLIFAQMDVKNPFLRSGDTMINSEEIMISNDFIPELIPAISKCFTENNFIQLEECLNAFDFLMNKVLDGINHAYEIASGGMIKIELDETLYNMGNIFSELEIK
jgi:hypothetical protein